MPELRQALWDAGLSEDIYLEHQDLPGTAPGDIRSQYQQWLSSGRTEPDILAADTAFTIPFVAQEQFLNLSENLPSEKLDVVTENYASQLFPTVRSSDGDFYGIPFSTDVPGLLYRKDLVTEAGYDPEGENWAQNSMTWKRFSEIVADTQQRTGTEHGFVFQAKAYEGLSACNFNEWLTSFGGAFFGGRENLFGPVGKRPITVDESPVLDSLRMIRTFIHGQDDEQSLDGYTGGISPRQVLQFTEPESRTVFANGNSVALRAWPQAWQTSGSEENYGTDLGVMPIPSGVSEAQAKNDGTGGIGRSFIGGYSNHINPHSKKIDAAVEVLTHMIGNVEFRYHLFNASVVPPNLSMLDTERFQNAPVLGRYTDVIKIHAQRGIPRPATIAWNPESAKIASQVNSTLARDATPAKAMGTLKSQLADIEERLSQ
ncbi:sugar ABC transporter substrate binding protein [Haloferax gibbonsii ATCC 33959]|uniref:Sugar ABC transporter substrate binding protein n=1 Tax=Haloferax gibbonsii (strain ATCC 33959 / DSM 4427 / JCM 8863 / NBRC 102184 / NCIMB 2188 / Ma 2.38) TaxID=1227459 RepID=M0GXL2_HALGM|nr:extracellular solute-binding protein [Haloferax gibbonsii]ELZ76313.1 sugar ABC transporter substrate binding protein [Haloferax gibbonsii ATCC 33959]